MSKIYLKKASFTSQTDASNVHQTVQNILSEIEEGGDQKALEYAAKFDKYVGNVLLDQEEIKKVASLVPEKLKQDIIFAHDSVKQFVEAQLSAMQDVELEVVPGSIAGQKSIPVNTAGCYITGGRYSHITSAIMTVTTAKVAGCQNIIVYSPPRPGEGITPAIIFAADQYGADTILAMGGV